MKKIIILEHGGGELANQLWNFASIYAYCRERGFSCQNYSFFEYGKYFNIPLENKIIAAIFFRPFSNYHKRRSGLKARFWRFIYKLYAKLVTYLHSSNTISSVNTAGDKYYLPPTASNPPLEKAEQNNDTLYFVGWLFRNPVGLQRYRKDIVDYFKPKSKYVRKAEAVLLDAKRKYRDIVGVHIRQTDYKIYRHGKYFISQSRVSEILKEYLSQFNKKSDEALFIITSDEPVQPSIFDGLNILVNNGNPIEDLCLLSLCDTIIGSNSSFGNFAAYYGDKPHIIFENEPIDWNYYKDKKNYFENKYSVMADNT